MTWTGNGFREDTTPTTDEKTAVGSLLLARRGAGAKIACLLGEESVCRTFSKLHVSDQSETHAIRLLRSVESGHTNVGQIDQLADRLGIDVPPVRMDSQAKYAVLAAGAGEAYFRLLSSKQPNYKEKIWDHAAGALILAEAGGKITDLDGKPLDFSHGRTLQANRGICATNGLVHDAVLHALRDVGC